MRDCFQAKLVHNPCASHIYTTSIIYEEGTQFVIDMTPWIKKFLSLRKVKFLRNLS